jgi:hypothetical protein
VRDYERFGKAVDALMGADLAVRILNPPYMPLVVERLPYEREGRGTIALSHTGEQNGDLMRDPEVVFWMRRAGSCVTAEPVSFRNDYTGTMQEVYFAEEGKNYVRPKLRDDLRSFCRTWFRNLREQGFFSDGLTREIIGG